MLATAVVPLQMFTVNMDKKGLNIKQLKTIESTRVEERERMNKTK